MPPDKKRPGRRTPVVQYSALATADHRNDQQPEGSPRLDADAVLLLTEAARFWSAGEAPILHALLSDDHDELVAAAEHIIIMNARARRFVSIAIHFDLEAVA